MEEMFDLFGLKNDYKINPKKKIRLIELFAGIGAQAKALENLGVNFEHYKICEFDKYAVASYNGVHQTNFTTSDITKIHSEDLDVRDTDKYEYIMTYSFPCTDLSLAGKQLGMKRGSSTRSGLLWEVERLLKELNESTTLSLPQILCMENVPQVIGTKNIKDFEEWLQFLRSLGYSNYYKILNAKDFGIPQNRERCFMISILGDYSYEFPKGFPLKLRLKDVLEKEVDEKYYLSNSKLESISNWKAYQDPLKDIDKEKLISPTLTARGAGEEHSGMILINEETLGKKLCNSLVENKSVKESDVITTTYANTRLTTGKKIIINKTYPNCSPTLTTSCSSLDVTVNDNDIAQTIDKNCNDLDEVVQDSLKTELCNKLIESGKVKAGDVIRHSYTNNRFRELDIGKIRKANSDVNISPTLDTRCDCLGVCVSNKSIYDSREESSINAEVQNPLKGKTNNGWHFEQQIYEENGIIRTLKAGGGSGNIPKVIKKGNYMPSGHNASAIVSKEGIAPTVMENHGTVTAVVDNYVGLFDYNKSDNFMKNRSRETLNAEILPTLTTKGSDNGVIESNWTEQQAKMITDDGNVRRYLNSDVIDKFEENQCADISFPNGYNKGPRVHNECPTINTTTTESSFITKESNLRIRKLTPKECWRLMGFDDESFDRAKTNLSITFYNGQDRGNSQLYKQAGNSIVVQVLEALFKQLL